MSTVELSQLDPNNRFSKVSMNYFRRELAVYCFENGNFIAEEYLNPK